MNYLNTYVRTGMAVYVTKYLSAIWHAILDNFRPITIWVLDLYIYYSLFPGTGIVPYRILYVSFISYHLLSSSSIYFLFYASFIFFYNSHNCDVRSGYLQPAMTCHNCYVLTSYIYIYIFYIPYLLTSIILKLHLLFLIENSVVFVYFIC